MDKIKPVLAAMVVNRFWILCGVAAVVCFVGWFLATGKLGSERQSRQTEILTAFSTAESTNLAGVQTGGGTVHPNPVSSQAFTKSIGQLTDSVYDAWLEQYNYQGEDIFVWPQELPENFRAIVGPLRPIETKAKYSPDRDPRDELLDVTHRQTYRDFIQSELPSLAEIVRARWILSEAESRTIGFGRSAPIGQDPQDSESTPYVVVWDSSNQRYVTQIFDWSKSASKIPTTLEVLYAQEDLWVLKTVMNVIRNTNGDADAPHNAIIKRVHNVYIGRAAATESKSSVTVLTAELTGTYISGDEDEDDLEDFEEDEEEEEFDDDDDEEEFEISYVADPAEGRYVDADFLPIPGDQLRSDSNSTDPGIASPASVAKRMPIRMKVTIDQRRLNNLLVECANSPLTIEIRQVRILRSSAGEATGFGNRSRETPFPYDAQVELFGIIYIFNPVPAREQDADDADQPAATAGATPAPAVDAPGGATPAEVAAEG